MPDSIQVLKKKLEAIRDMGFVKTHRAGAAGIGKTLEDLLGMGHEKAGNKRVRYFTPLENLVIYRQRTCAWGTSVKGEEPFMKNFLTGFKNFDNFLKFTGMLIEETDWDKVGIHPDNENGTFDIRRLKELIDFCKKHPRYH